MSNLPTELVDDILAWLPVKPLLRFRCVSKRCLALVDSLDIIKLHLSRSIETRNNRSLLFTSLRSRTTYSVNADSTDLPVETDHPSKNFFYEGSPEVMCSCNGLVLLCYGYESYDDDIIVIWNPCTRNYHRLPIAGIDSIADPGKVVYGIGYDAVHDDYKVVRIIQFLRGESDDDTPQEVKIYSLKSNEWRRIHDFPYYLLYKLHHGVFCSGAIHWVVSENAQSDSTFIAAFDLATEEYLSVLMPNITDMMLGKYIAVLQGCLCVICMHPSCMDVWVMKSYRVRESWTKLISVDTNEFIYPLVFSKDVTEVLMQRGSDLIWFDHQSKEEYMNNGIHSFSRVEVVTQSLVPLGRGSRIYA